jgi:hypothetical protein
MGRERGLLRYERERRRARGPPIAGRRRSRKGCDVELATDLLASKFFQSLGIKGVLVCFECLGPLLPQADFFLGPVIL